MNNKKLGTVFENEFCELLKQHGFWVHFCSPNGKGAQPCDIIAVKNGEAFLIDCKTSVKETFSLDRLEDNQKYAFEKWHNCGNKNRYIAVKYKDNIYILPYIVLYHCRKLKIEDYKTFENWVDYYGI